MEAAEVAGTGVGGMAVIVATMAGTAATAAIVEGTAVMGEAVGRCSALESALVDVIRRTVTTMAIPLTATLIRPRSTRSPRMSIIRPSPIP